VTAVDVATYVRIGLLVVFVWMTLAPPLIRRRRRRRDWFGRS